MPLTLKSYHVLQEHILRIRKADEHYARHMWDEDSIDALNGFIEALADLATEVEFSILETEKPLEEKNRLSDVDDESENHLQ